MKRKGLTIVELLVIFALMAILIALLIPAVVKCRDAAAFSQSTNNLRQIALATLEWSSSRRNELPPIRNFDGSEGVREVFVSILPYLDQEPLYLSIDTWKGAIDFFTYRVGIYQSPLDPSPSSNTNDGRSINYAANAMVFSGQYPAPPTLATIADGVSNTIMFSEHYQQCGGVSYSYMDSSSHSRIEPEEPSRRPTFSDGGPEVTLGFNPGDYYPITINGNSAAAQSAIFQVAPRASDCNPRLPNATSYRGLQTMMADGSFRVFAAGASPHVFWNAVTPNGNEPPDIE